MTVEQQSGRAIVLLSLVVFVVVSLAMLLWDAATNGAIVLAAHIPRLGLIIVLFIWLMRGNMMAKWVLVALLAVGGAIGGYALYAGGSLVVGILGLVHLVLAVLLATSSSVNDYIAHERTRAQATR